MLSAAVMGVGVARLSARIVSVSSQMCFGDAVLFEKSFACRVVNACALACTAVIAWIIGFAFPCCVVGYLFAVLCFSLTY